MTFEIAFGKISLNFFSQKGSTVESFFPIKAILTKFLSEKLFFKNEKPVNITGFFVTNFSKILFMSY